jgi:hypothetical protein
MSVMDEISGKISVFLPLRHALTPSKAMRSCYVGGDNITGFLLQQPQLGAFGFLFPEGDI